MDVRDAQTVLDEVVSALVEVVTKAPGIRLSGGDPAMDATTAANLAEHLDGLRDRGLATLARVALIGKTSSGKSALVSALQERLDHVRRETELDGLRDEYTGLLPSSSRMTSICPVAVGPWGLEATERDTDVDRLEVTFLDGGLRSIDRASPADVMAYLTGFAIEGRQAADRRRTPTDGRLQLRACALPVELVDLPGFGSEDRTLDRVASDYLARADAFIFATRANTTMGDDELDLISRLYDQHVAGGGLRPVTWLVTAIDSAAQVDGDEVAWRTTLTRNDELLTERFGQREHGATFIGDGFSGVSAHADAQVGALLRDRPGDTDLLQRRERTGLPALRRALIELGRGRAGWTKLADLGAQLARVADQLDQSLEALADDEERPMAEIDGEVLRLQQTVASISRLAGEHLDAQVAVAHRRVEDTYKGHGRQLERELVRRLTPVVDGLDMTKPGERIAADEALRSVCREYVEGSDSPAHVWAVRFKAWKTDLLREVEPVIAFTPRDVSEETHPLDALVTTSRMTQAGPRVMDDAAKYLGLTGAAGTATAAAAVASGVVTATAAAALAPLAAIALAAGLVVVSRRRQIPGVQAAAKTEYIESLGPISTEMIELLFAAAMGEVEQLADDLRATFVAEHDEVTARMSRLQERRGAPTHVEAGAIVAELRDLAGSAATAYTASARVALDAAGRAAEA